MEELVTIAEYGGAFRVSVARTGQVIALEGERVDAEEMADLGSVKLALDKDIPLDKVLFRLPHALDDFAAELESLRTLPWEKFLANLSIASLKSEPQQTGEEGLQACDDTGNLGSSQPHDSAAGHAPEQLVGPSRQAVASGPAHSQAGEAAGVQPAQACRAAAGGAAAQAAGQRNGVEGRCTSTRLPPELHGCKQTPGAGTWSVQVSISSCPCYLGSYSSREAAGMARDTAVLWRAERQGARLEDLTLNFPLHIYTSDAQLMEEIAACQDKEHLKALVRRRYQGPAGAVLAAEAVAAAGPADAAAVGAMPAPMGALHASGPPGAAASGAGAAAISGALRAAARPAHAWQLLPEGGGAKKVLPEGLKVGVTFSESAWQSVFCCQHPHSRVVLQQAASSPGDRPLSYSIDVSHQTGKGHRLGRGWAAVVKGLNLQAGDTLVLRRPATPPAAAPGSGLEAAELANQVPLALVSVERGAAAGNGGTAEAGGGTPTAVGAAVTAAASGAAFSPAPPAAAAGNAGGTPLIGRKRALEALGLSPKCTPGSTIRQKRLDTMLQLYSKQAVGEGQQREVDVAEALPAVHPSLVAQHIKPEASSCQTGNLENGEERKSNPDQQQQQQQPSHSMQHTGTSTALAQQEGGLDVYRMYHKMREAMKGCSLPVELRHAYFRGFQRLPLWQQRLHYDEVMELAGEGQAGQGLLRQFLESEVRAATDEAPKVPAPTHGGNS